MRAFRDISYTRPIDRVGLADDRYSLLTKSQLGKCQSVSHFRSVGGDTSLT